MNTEELLEQRSCTHGNFSGTANLAQDFKNRFRITNNWAYLTSLQIEALEMMCTKFARILNGGIRVADHWQDIAGYAQLVVNELNAQEAKKTNDKCINQHQQWPVGSVTLVNEQIALDATKLGNRTARAVPRQPHAPDVSDL